MAIAGGVLRLVLIGCYALAFCCAAIITGVFAWFTATRFGDYNLASLILGAGTLLYSFVAALTCCFTAGVGFFSACAVLFDLISIGAMMAVAILNRSATEGCDERPYPRDVYAHWGRRRRRLLGCELFVATFAVSIIAIFAFAIAIVAQMAIRGRNRRSSTSKV